MRKTRAQVWQKGQDWREQTAETVIDGVAQVRAEVDQVTTNIQKQAEDLQERGQNVVEQQKERWAPVVEGKRPLKAANSIRQELPFGVARWRTSYTNLRRKVATWLMRWLSRYKKKSKDILRNREDDTATDRSFVVINCLSRIGLY